VEELQRLLGADRVRTSYVDRLAFAHDASLYRIVPEVVVRPATPQHVTALFRWCTSNNSAITFRAGGTSLSGQALSHKILADLSRDWTKCEVLDNGARVRMQPGITGARVNALLRPYGTKLGPDPASIIAAMVGGIVANNASGMCCGTKQNSYNTLDAMEYQLANGVRINTAQERADGILASAAPQIHREIKALRDAVRSNPELVATIQRKYAIKNTMGYSLNAFLDEDQPARIIARLLIGSEGTLGFIESVTLRTIPSARASWTTIVLYNTLDEAAEAVTYWRDHGAAAIEIMDDASLRSVAHLPTTPTTLRTIRDGSAALLVEFHDVQPPHVAGVTWATAPSEQAVLWKVRKGLMPTVGSMRPVGTTMINEDIAVPPQSLVPLIRDVQAAFVEFGYHDGVIFGHAKDGNIHFVLHQAFTSDADTDQYDRFMRRIADIVVDRYQGSLKAEHGTGRNMAPFVEQEWGKDATDVMRRVKQILDPRGILNPGVVLNDDPMIHVRDIKPVPELKHPLSSDSRPKEDLCIECGFCEHVCPTRAHTLTPRQRIVLQREILIHADEPRRVSEIERAFHYDGIDSCATDGMCATVCPVGIDTGDMIKRKRASATPSLVHRVAAFVARRMTLAHVGMRAVTSVWRSYGSYHAVKRTRQAEPHVLYVQTCPSRWFGGRSDRESLDQIVLSLGERAGLRMQTISGTSCCGQPFSSKGLYDAANAAQNELLDRIVAIVSKRDMPVVVDASTCAAALIEGCRARGIRVLDQTAFAELVLERIPIRHRRTSVAIHPGCGSAKLGRTDAFIRIAERCAISTYTPVDSGCCGMGGDRGILHPSIVEAANAAAKQQLPPTVRLGVSANSLCEGALRKSMGIQYVSLLHLVEEVTRS
jgi:D-lactate dehydrogenase